MPITDLRPRLKNAPNTIRKERKIYNRRFKTIMLLWKYGVLFFCFREA